VSTGKKAHPVIYILTAVFMTALSTAAAYAAAIVPYEKCKTYLDLAFMDSMKILPASGVSGLVIKENDQITTEKKTEQKFSETGTVKHPDFGEQYAVLECKSVSMNVPVYWGTDNELLEHGACQTTSSKVIGEVGNVVIDAHVNTFFADLDKISKGDEIVLYTEYGVFTYKVKELVTFENTDKRYVLPTSYDRLTLYTCKQQVLGSSTTRIGVLCDLVSRQFYIGEEAAE
jgi:sortase A